MQEFPATGAMLMAELSPIFAALARLGGGHASGLTSTQRLLLQELVDRGPLRLGALAEAIGATDPTTSRAVDGLVTTGLVGRRADPDDRRAVLHVATPRGKSWAQRRRTEVAAALDRALARLSNAEQARLLHAVAKLSAALQDADSQSPAHPTLLASR